MTFESVLLTILPLAGFTFGIFLYCLFVFKFLRFVARRELFKRDLVEFKAYASKTKKFFAVVMAVIQAVILYPLVIFFWFLILALLLVLFSSGQALTHILLVSMALIAVVRMLAYYEETFAMQVSQLLPFALLGVLLIQGANTSIFQNLEILNALPEHVRTLGYYFGFVIVLEAGLHGLYALANRE